ncbi:hypothetical protein ACFFKE_13235 [Streptomyces mutabilis]|uniref:hypothetical protein n=1 Tax=Streptomyces mutabilis TaxID=67332 RepID=UPI0017842192|nr:hypothetical protein [Streptomyces mutabilis]GGQ18922.1 hypothetical protein GCM10010279_28360 [Streptomyces mutabilis]
MSTRTWPDWVAAHIRRATQRTNRPPTPEEPAPIHATPAPSRTPSLAGALGCGCVALVAAAVLAVVVPLMWQNRDASDFPRVGREDMASRALQNSRQAYGVLGFERAVEPGVEDRGVGTENTFGSGACYDVGLLGLQDKVVDGAYRMHHSWAVDHVPSSRAVPGLRRLRQHLEDEGWKINTHREGGKAEEWRLSAERDHGDERMSFTWDPDSEYFTGGSGVPCAYDPDRDVDSAGAAVGGPVPPVLRPV